MKLATHETKWLFDLKGKLLGIQGGFDYAAEHEWGIRGIFNAFGISGEENGVERTRIRVVPPRFVRFEKGKANGLFLRRGLESYYKTPETYFSDWKRIASRNGGLQFAWDGDTFGFLDFSPEGKARTDELYEAFQRRDIAIGGGAGLTFKIVSRISKKEIEERLAKDLDQKALKAAAEATGIEKELRAAGKDWYALSPRWADESKTSVTFWLNPVDQRNNNYGSFTVDDLRLWAQGKGPIPISPKDRRR